MAFISFAQFQEKYKTNIFVVVGCVWTQILHWYHGLKQGTKLEGYGKNVVLARTSNGRRTKTQPYRRYQVRHDTMEENRDQTRRRAEIRVKPPVSFRIGQTIMGYTSEMAVSSIRNANKAE